MNQSDNLPDPRARAFVEARRAGSVVPTYPGDIPQTPGAAYAVQDSAIRLWPDELAGWKVGGISPEWRELACADRLVGPVFLKQVHADDGKITDMPVFENGFAAVEGEVTVVIAKDVPAGKANFSIEEARGYIASVHVGVEIASSPFPGINDHGPLVTITDFGNNMGLIVGERIEGWQGFSVDDWVFETRIDDVLIGRGTPNGMPGGPLESVRYALEITARRGFPLRRGMMILTGAVTGVHQAATGNTASVRLAGGKAIRCRLVPFRAAADIS